MKDTFYRHCLVKAATLEKIKALLRTRWCIYIGDQKTQILNVMFDTVDGIMVKVKLPTGCRFVPLSRWSSTAWIFTNGKPSIADMFEEEQ